MSKGLALLGLELARWRALAGVALLAGLIPLALGLPIVSGGHGAEVRDGSALVLALSLAALGAVQAGLGRLGAPRERAFLLGLGLPAAAIWAGQLGAAWGGAVAVLVLGLLPATLVGGGLLGSALGDLLAWPYREWAEVVEHSNAWVRSSEVLLPALTDPWTAWAPAPQVTLLALGLLGLVVLATFLGTALRDRGPRLILDVAGLGVVALGMSWALQPLLAQEAWGEVVLGGALLATALLFGGLLGSGLAVALGRADPGRSHLGASLGLWALALLGVGAVGARARWALDVCLADLDVVDWVEVAPQGTWAVLQGRARGRVAYHRVLVADLATGQAFPMEDLRDTWDWAFASDGRSLVWKRGERASPLFRDLGDPDREMVVVPGTFSSSDGIEALSPEGHLAIQDWHSQRVRVVALPGGHPVAMEPPTAGMRGGLKVARFLAGDRLQLVRDIACPEPERPERRFWCGVRVVDLGLGGEVLHSADIPVGARTTAFSFADGRLLLTARHPSAVVLLGGDGGGEEVTLDLPPEARIVGVVPLADGGFALAWRIPATEDRGLWFLGAFDADGTARGSPRALGLARRVRLGGAPAPGQVVVCRDDGVAILEAERRYRCALEPLDGGASVPLGDGLLPATPLVSYTGGQLSVPGAPATRIFRDAGGRLRWLDLEVRALVPLEPGMVR
ncbi:MAG: hypothetical protein ABIO70_30780 [Pseudomonadota bacterium]